MAPRCESPQNSKPSLCPDSTSRSSTISPFSARFIQRISSARVSRASGSQATRASIAFCQRLTFAGLIPRSRDYIVMATHEQGRWVFNPQDDHVVRAGAALVLMTNPGGRAQVEQMLAA